MNVTVSITFQLVSAGVMAIDETAEEGSDFVLIETSLEFLASDSEKTVTISIQDDAYLEDEECFILTLVPPALMDNVVVGTGPNATICIADNDIGWCYLTTPAKTLWV